MTALMPATKARTKPKPNLNLKAKQANTPAPQEQGVDFLEQASRSLAAAATQTILGQELNALVSKWQRRAQGLSGPVRDFALGVVRDFAGFDEKAQLYRKRYLAAQTQRTRALAEQVLRRLALTKDARAAQIQGLGSGRGKAQAHTQGHVPVLNTEEMWKQVLILASARSDKFPKVALQDGMVLIAAIAARALGSDASLAGIKLKARVPRKKGVPRDEL